MSSNITIRDFGFGWSDYGVRVSSSTDVLILNNHFDDQLIAGIDVDYSEDVSIVNNTIFEANIGISVSDSSNILVASNKLDVSSECAIWSASNDYIQISDNSIWGGNRGIISEYSRNSTIANNRLREISDSCIYLVNDDNISVNANNCGDGDYGVNGNYLTNSMLDNNEFYHTAVSVFIVGSYNCTISRTYTATSLYGIWITVSSDLLVEDNTILNADLGIYVAGIWVYYGVLASKFKNNTCMYGEIGISLSDSSNCTFVSNQLDYNDYGLYLQNVNYISLLNNSCSLNNELGMWIQDSNNCTYRFNLLQNNTLYGVIFESCHNNTLYHNAFLYNNLGGSSQAYDDTGTNFWYHIGLSEGNYWSGWNSGLGAYSIDGSGSATDLYPLDTSPL
jgi:parallel beta-helix repeat protein